MTGTGTTRRTFLQAAAVGAAALATSQRGKADAASPRDMVVLEFWNPATDPLNGGNMTRLVTQFNATVGKANGIMVRNHAVETSNSYVKYTTAMTSTGSPDVIMTYDATMIAGWAANGFIQPLDAFAAQMGVKAANYFPIAWETAHINGRLWGLLQEFDMQLLGWNTALHKGPGPRTIAALDALSQRYVKVGKKGNVVQVGLMPWAQGGYALWGAALGARFYNEQTGKWTINTPANRHLLEWFLKYAEMAGGRAKAESLVAVGGQLASNRGIFYTGGSVFGAVGEYDLIHLKVLAPHLKFSVGPVPTAPGVPAGSNSFPGGNLFLLPTKAAHPKEAAIFIRWMDSLQGLMQWCISAENLPPLVSAVNPLLKAVPAMRPWVEAAESPHVVPQITSPQFSLFDTQMSSAVDEVTFKRKTPAQALADVETKVKSAVQQFQQIHPTWPGE